MWHVMCHVSRVMCPVSHVTCHMSHGAFELKEKEYDKYLGEIFNSAGLGRSAPETIKARDGKIKAAGYEIKAIMEDYKAEIVGWALCGIKLWPCLPSYQLAPLG